MEAVSDVTEVLSYTIDPSGDERSNEMGCTIYLITFDVVLNLATTVFGVVGNSLTYWVFSKDRQKSSTAFLLSVLAIVDSVLLLVYGCLRAAYPIASLIRSVYFSKYVAVVFRAYGWALAGLTNTTATWCVVLVTVDRYVAICLPQKKTRWLAPANIRKTTAILLLACLGYSVTRFCRYSIQYDSAGSLRLVQLPWSTSPVYRYIHHVALFYLLVYVVPGVILIFCTFRLIRRLKAAASRRQEMTRSSREYHDVSVSLVAVVVVFLLCQGPNPVRRIWAEVVPANQRGCGSAYFYYSPICHETLMLNSAINFVIFILCSKGFRVRLAQMLFRCRPGRVGADTSSDTGDTSAVAASGSRTVTTTAKTFTA